MKMIKVNVRSTEAKIAEIVVTENGTVETKELENLQLEGTISVQRAGVYASRKYKGKQVVVLGVEHKTKVMGLSEEMFMKYAQDITMFEPIKF